jgi:hypothetical protein
VIAQNQNHFRNQGVEIVQKLKSEIMFFGDEILTAKVRTEILEMRWSKCEVFKFNQQISSYSWNTKGTS